MVAKGKCIKHVYNIHCIVLILVSKVLQNTNFFLSLSVKAFLVSDNLQRYIFSLFVVIGLHHLAEAPFTDNPKHLISVCHMIVLNINIGAVLVVILAVVREPYETWTFLRVGPDEVHLGVIEDLPMLERGEFVHVSFHNLVGARGSRWRALVRGCWRRGTGGGGDTQGLRCRLVQPEQPAPERRHVASHRGHCTHNTFITREQRPTLKSLNRSTAGGARERVGVGRNCC